MPSTVIVPEKTGLTKTPKAPCSHGAQSGLGQKGRTRKRESSWGRTGDRILRHREANALGQMLPSFLSPTLPGSGLFALCHLCLMVLKLSSAFGLGRGGTEGQGSGFGNRQILIQILTWPLRGWCVFGFCHGGLGGPHGCCLSPRDGTTALATGYVRIKLGPTCQSPIPVLSTGWGFHLCLSPCSALGFLWMEYSRLSGAQPQGIKLQE